MNLFRTRMHYPVARSLRIAIIVAVALFGLALSREVRAADADAAPDPELERKTFTVADGFEVNLWAGDELLAKPIQMNWDAQGRLWVATSTMYPQIKPGETPHDKIVILEDTDNDGKADKSTVFADNLLIPTGVVPGDGGAYVANSTEVLHLRDTNNDGKADERKVVLSGFGTEDTHHIIHTFHWGNDGRLYFNQSLYIHSHIETPHGVRTLSASGIWRFRPESVDLDVFARGMINPWGHAFGEWGDSFGTDGAGDGGIHYMFPGAAFVTADGYEKTIAGLNGGNPKYCGLDLVSGRHMPDDWQGDAITNDFRANRVVRFKITDESGHFVSKQMPDVIVSTDVAFRPIDVRMGPDGAIYIADWYNPIINHGEVDFRDPRRDHTHGRIWRITAKNRPLIEKPKLVGVPLPQLLDQLKSPEQWTRSQAKIELRARGAKDVLPALETWLKTVDDTDPRADHHRLEALWVYQSLDIPQPDLLSHLLRSKVPQARAAATRVLADWIDRIPQAQHWLAAQVKDDFPRTRLEAICALSHLKKPSAIELVMTALDQPRDRFIDFALWQTARDTEDVWMPAVRSGELTFGGYAAHLIFALQAVKSPEASQILAARLREKKLAAGDEQAAFDLIGSAGQQADVQIAFDIAVGAKDASDAPARQASALVAVEQAAARGVLPAKDSQAKLAPLLSVADESIRVPAIRLAGKWKEVDADATLRTLAADASLSANVRNASMQALADRGGDANAAALRALDVASQPFAVRAQAVIALSQIDLNDAATRALTLLAAAPAEDPSAVLAGLLQRQGAGAALAKAASTVKLPADIAGKAQKYVASTGRDEALLLSKLRDTAGGGAAATARQLSPAEMEKQVADVKQFGDAARGEMIFRRDSLACMKCHAIAGVGGQLAPDLSSIGASAPIDYLVDSILDPNKAIKDGYQSIIVSTKDRDVHSGIQVSRDDKQLVMRDALRDHFEIPLNTIVAERPGGSLMPTGLGDSIPTWEFASLVRFLSELGKPGGYQIGHEKLIRRWRTLTAKDAARVEKDPALLTSDAAGKVIWFPAYSLVSGSLPPDAMASDGQPVAYIRGEVDASAAGQVTLSIGSTTGLTFWLDNQPHDLKPETSLDLKPGQHTLTFRVDIAARGQGLRAEIKDIDGSAANVQPVIGR